jgi:hypothetical protein
MTHSKHTEKVTPLAEREAKASHTPAPWELCNRTNAIVWEQDWSNGKQFLISSHSVLKKGRAIEPLTREEAEEHKANAHLIAAAPELLEALEAAKAHMQNPYPAGDDLSHILARAEAAIEKAKGES